MGTPSVEKLFSGQECRTALENVQKVLLSDAKELELGESQNGVKYAAVNDLEMDSDEVSTQSCLV